MNKSKLEKAWKEILEKEDNYELIECPKCHAQVRKLKHYGVTQCEKCKTPILCI
ncbi:MAG: hypothetical protein OEZ40_01560 [Candidatus Bathyarchaeota archaeon]|nr:hypothetical protein [Candidatus Bathyarchaeota archaeon]